MSLMGFLMTQYLVVPRTFAYISLLIMVGGARFLPRDPAGLFAKFIVEGDGMMPALFCVDTIMDRLCPLDNPAEFAWNILARGETAQGDFRRIVQGADLRFGWNILHMYTMFSRENDELHIAQRLRIARDVYGLNLHDRASSGRKGRYFVFQSNAAMKSAIWTVMQEEIHRALPPALEMSHLPRDVLERVGFFADMPILHEVVERLRPKRWESKLHSSLIPKQDADGEKGVAPSARPTGP